MTKLTMQLTITPDVLAMEVARHGLKEIVQLANKDPFGFSGDEAKELAQETLNAVDELEAKGSIYGT